MSLARIRTLLLAMLALNMAALVLAAQASAQANAEEGEWRLEQPARPPAPVGIEEAEVANVPIGLGRISDIAFWSANRGALITAGNGSTTPPGVWVYNGDCVASSCAQGWHELSTVCGASDGRIAWAGPDEFWTISDGRRGQLGESKGNLPPIEDDTLCRFGLNKVGEFEVLDSYATLAFQSTSYPMMYAAACFDESDCWFGGEALAAPQVGAFHLHWNGATLIREPYLPEGHAVKDMALFEGDLYESVKLSPSDRILQNEGKAGEVPALHLINPEGVSPVFEPVLNLPLLGQGPCPSEEELTNRCAEFPQALEYLHLSANESALWAAAGPVPENERSPKSGKARVTIARYSKIQYSSGSQQYEETGSPTWTQVLGPGTEPSGEAAFPQEGVRSIAAEPATNSAWLGLDSWKGCTSPDPCETAQELEEFEEKPGPTTRAKVAQIAADGSVSNELELPAPGTGLGPKGAVETIVCPAVHDCWMTTTEGWLFHLATNAERESPAPNSDPAFSGSYLITERPADESVPQEVSDALPIDDSGIEEGEAAHTSALVKPAVVNPFATVTVPLLSNVHSRLIHGTTLELSFHLSVTARVRLLAKRHKSVVASTRAEVLKAGNRSLLLRLDIHRWPTKLNLQTHALAPLKTTSTRESNSSTNTVTSSLSFPNTGAWARAGFLGSDQLP
ncbi:MAG TPA: hypothetical protein VIH71_07645 [Solirubrobacteraceae bacterium]